MTPQERINTLAASRGGIATYPASVKESPGILKRKAKTMDELWQLKQTKQCTKCPWRVDVNPHHIPNGYSVEKHCALKSTIAKCADISNIGGVIMVMACHETHDNHCIGWLINQLGPGNNIPLRFQMMNCMNARDMETIGDQYEMFEETLPS